MSKVVLILLLLTTAAICSPAQSHDSLQPPPKENYKYDGKIITTYDKAKDETQVAIQLMSVKDIEDPRPLLEDNAEHPVDRSWLGFTVFFTYPGQSVTTPKEVSIGFLYDVLEPKHFEGHVLTAKIDGEKTTFGKMEVLNTKIINRKWARYTRSTLELVVPYEQLLRLANAKKVRLTLGSFEFNLSKDHLEAIRDLASRTTS
jgi:hypothetical protein